MFSEDSAEAICVYPGPRSPLGIEIRTDPDIVVDIVVVDVAVRIDDAGVVGIVSISRPQPPIGRILQPYPYM